MARSAFIVIEGLDGSGKTVQVDRLAAALRAEGRAVHTTTEPSEGPIGRFLRDALRPDGPSAGIGDAALAYLFAADRRDHLDREILPALASGAVVLSDRYYHSSLAYQSLALGLPMVATLNAGFRKPDATVFLGLSPEACLARVMARGLARERFEALDRLRLVRDAYDQVLVHCRAEGETILRVDASGPPEDVEVRVRAALAPLLDAATLPAG